MNIDAEEMGKNSWIVGVVFKDSEGCILGASTWKIFNFMNAMLSKLWD